MSNRFKQSGNKTKGAAPEYSRFVADIGGTHARFALVDNSSGPKQRSLVEIKVFNCADFAGPAETVIAYQNYLGHSLPDRACIAAAGPVSGGEVHFTNLDWTMSATELRKELQLKQLEIVNDFTAVAHAISKLSPGDTRVIHAGNGPNKGLKVVVGAGTGLGGAALTTVNGETRVFDSEGGHNRFAPADEEERELLKFLSREHNFVSAEMLLSGPGIRSIYKALCQMNSHPFQPMSAEEITSHARNGTRPDCEHALKLYTRILASFCTNLATTFNARGGIFLVGTIFRSIEPFLTDCSFQQRFLKAGAMSDMVADTPVSLVLVEDPGLYGAAYCTID